MERISRETLAMDAAERWRKQYPKEKSLIYNALKGLGSSPIPDTVDEIIGNGSWTRVPECSECGDDNLPYVILVGEDPWYESMTAYLCGPCVVEAYKL